MFLSMEEQMKRARSIFSKMPDQLFDMYIRSLIHDVGYWPFCTCSDLTSGTDWHRIFSTVSLYEQATCSWKLDTITPDCYNITPRSLGDINLMLQNYEGTLFFKVGGYDYDYCKKSTEYHIRHLQKFGTYYLPVVIYPIVGQFHVLDGNHRIGAALHLLATIGQSYSIPAWIAEV